MSAAPFTDLSYQGSHKDHEQLTSELLPETPRTGRARPFGPIRRALYGRRPTHTTAFVTFLVIACAARYLWGSS